LSIVVLNIALAAAAAIAAPSQIGETADRLGYEYVGVQPLAPNCPHNIFCYRVLVPAALEHIPKVARLGQDFFGLVAGIDVAPAVRWRAFAVTANATTGVLVAALATGAGVGAVGAAIASILFQTSFGATFAVFDPFTPDPAVFLAAALIALAWLRNWPLLAFLVGVVGIFAKETVALALTAAAIAAWLDERSGGASRGTLDSSGVTSPRGERAAHLWLLAAGLTWLVLLSFHLAMDRLAGWSEAASGSADLTGGAWLGRWLADPTLTPAARLLYLFIPFGFAWIFAILGLRNAAPRLKYLALGALIVVPPLVYVQTAERALATAFFVVVPLAAIFLARLPPTLGLAAAITNGLLTARVGLSPTWLPPLPYLFALAAIVAALAIFRGFVKTRPGSSATLASSRVASSR
jgi:hypothetical protein